MSDPLRRFDDLAFDAGRVASGRIGRIVAAYVAAVVVGSLLRTFGLVIEESLTSGFSGIVRRFGWSSLLVVPIMTSVVALIAAAPFATAFFVVAEGRATRSRLAWILAGAAIAVIAQLLVTVPFGADAPALGLLGLDALAGALAGSVGWIVGVRSAPPPPVRDPWADI